MNQRPGDIKFFEEASLQGKAVSKSFVTRFVKKITFGLIKNDTQASIVVFALLAVIGALMYLNVETNKTNPPTKYYEILPQESVGSPQGRPANRI